MVFSGCGEAERHADGHGAGRRVDAADVRVERRADGHRTEARRAARPAADGLGVAGHVRERAAALVCPGVSGYG